MTGPEITSRLTDPWFVISQVRDLAEAAWYSFASTGLARSFRTVRGRSMCGAARLRALYRAVEQVVHAGIPGDVVECGTARGGSAAIMALALRELDPKRRVWLFDTFEGLPPPSAGDPDRHVAELYVGECRGDLADVEAFLASIGVRDRCTLVKGLFQDTLPRTDPGQIAVLHLDGDWYESVKICLDHLYDRVSPGGIVQLDDYGHWQGARRAIEEFLSARAIDQPLRWIDYTGRQLVKP